jgi:hypothetical protein
MLFQVAFLRGRQLMVEQHDFDLVPGDQFGDFFKLALADKCFCHRLLPTTDNCLNIDNIGGSDKFLKFSQVILI